MPIKPAVLVFAVLAMLSITTKAQLLGPGWEVKITLKQSDMALIHRTAEQVHGKSVGTVASWSNTATGNYGSIRLMKKYQRQNRPCEQLRYTVQTTARAVTPEHYVFDSCLQPDGSWKIS